MCIHRLRSVSHVLNGQHFNSSRINIITQIILLLSVFNVPLSADSNTFDRLAIHYAYFFMIQIFILELLESLYIFMHYYRT